MGPCLVGGTGLFTAFDTMAIDETRWKVGGCIANKAAGAASRWHFVCLFNSMVSTNEHILISGTGKGLSIFKGPG